ncbi:MAG TPA: protein phosphatase 2C domain-containing protein [Streptosporangiaceae bacterium]
MQVSHATDAAPGRPNEDLVVTGPDWAVVLDGATPSPGVASGCGHSVRWFTRRLGAALCTRLLADDDDPLPDLLAAAIGEVRTAHGDGCDLENPDSPSSTVAITRMRAGRLEYLVLCDSPVALRRNTGDITVIADDRLARLPGGPPYTVERVRACRNAAGGFWVASTKPAAASHAVCGSVPLDEVADAVLCSDGVTRLIEWYGYSWPEVFARLAEDGPATLIRRLRERERAQPRPGAKQHDDASVIYLRM